MITFAGVKLGGAFIDCRNGALWVKIGDDLAIVASGSDEAWPQGLIDDFLATERVTAVNLTHEASAVQLQRRHSPEHPKLTRRDWLARCADMTTQAGYWQWVAQQREIGLQPKYADFSTTVQREVGEVRMAVLLSLFNSGFSASEAIAYLNIPA